MIENIFQMLSPKIAQEYIAYINCAVENCSLDIKRLYNMYTALDAYYPRPILTYLGINYSANDLSEISNRRMPEIIYVPQIVRDFLAIHDDIIDEDIVKFNTDTLPFAISKLYNPKIKDISQKGKNLSLLFADYILPIVYDITCHSQKDEATRLELIQCINRVLLKTNIGQIEELELEQRPLRSISESEIFSLYEKKAADYCYAFPLELGLLYTGASKELITEARSILLKMGVCSQVVNDIEGVFFENYGDERKTVSDLFELRRTYLLVKLAKTTTNASVQAILNKEELTDVDVQIVKNEMLTCNVLKSVCADIEDISLKLYNRIESLNVGFVLKSYLQELVNMRILANLRKVSNYTV